MRILKKALILFALLLLSGCGPVSHEIDSIDLIKSYKDIPGVTEEEIAAIEELKSVRGSFTYGSVFDAEAFILSDGSYAGFSPKFCGLLSELFGIEFTMSIRKWDSLIDGLSDMSIDFAGELSPTTERVQYFYMSYPIAERTQKIFTLSGNNKIEGEEDIIGLKIGFIEGTVDIDAVHEYYPDITFNAVAASSLVNAVEMLKNGSIDAVIAEGVKDPMFDVYDFIESKEFFPLVYTSVSLATANPDLAVIISVVNKYISAGGIDKLFIFYKEGAEEYTRYKLWQRLAGGEKYYINKKSLAGETIKVALQEDNYPISFYNETDKEYQGIAVDILEEISKLTGLSFEYADTKGLPSSTALEMLKTGEVSIIPQLIKTEARKDFYLWPDTPYATTNYTLISKIGYPNLSAFQVSRATVGIVKGTIYDEKYRAWFPENDNTIEYDSINSALAALEKDEINLLMGSYYLLLAEQNYREKPGYKTNILFGFPMDSYFGINKNEDTLCSIISKAQGYVDTATIVNYWESRGFDYIKRFTAERTMYLAVFIVFLFAILIVTAALLVHNVKLRKELHKIASQDVLTGILNRRYFMENSVLQIERSRRIGSECFVIIFDIDHFKKVNDTHGHQAGDKVLREVASRVKKSIRPYDLFGRYGGEEFIILMADIKKDDVIKAAERMRKDIHNTPMEFDGKKITVSASFGIAYAAPPNDIERATKYADEALYQAKNSGRNKTVFYEIV